MMPYLLMMLNITEKVSTQQKLVIFTMKMKRDNKSAS